MTGPEGLPSRLLPSHIGRPLERLGLGPIVAACGPLDCWSRENVTALAASCGLEQRDSMWAGAQQRSARHGTASGGVYGTQTRGNVTATTGGWATSGGQGPGFLGLVGRSSQREETVGQLRVAATRGTTPPAMRTQATMADSRSLVHTDLSDVSVVAIRLRRGVRRVRASSPGEVAVSEAGQALSH